MHSLSIAEDYLLLLMIFFGGSERANVAWIERMGRAVGRCASGATYNSRWRARAGDVTAGMSADCLGGKVSREGRLPEDPVFRQSPPLL